MKMLLSAALLWFAIAGSLFAQNKTYSSLFLKKDSIQLAYVESQSGDMFQVVGHHGPAIENEWVGYRLYFDQKAAVDVYNKVQPKLELADAKWYPTAEQQQKGWGADYYKVGSTVGIGGIRLWDGTKVCSLQPVSKRSARVVTEANISYLEMYSQNVPYKGDSVDVMVRITVFSGKREALVEAFCSKTVQFTTGINFHKATTDFAGKGYTATWGLHPEDVAAFPMNIGGGIVFRPSDFESNKRDEKEYIMVSKPTQTLSYWISSACEKEQKLNNFADFKAYLKGLADTLK
jgi:hypothetical protein